MDVSIQTATHDDLAALGQLLRQLFAIEADFDFDSEKVELALKQLLNDERGCVLVARSGGDVIGMCTAQRVVSTAEGGYSAWIEDVVVDGSYRGQGIGKQLLDGIRVWAKDQGIVRLQLLADVENRSALAFYNHTGWQQTQLMALRKTIGV